MSRRRRPTTEEEVVLFREAMGETPKPAPTSRTGLPAPPQAPRKSPTGADPARPAGIDGRTADRLDRGRLEPQSRLDLHGMTETEAHLALVHFVRTAHAGGQRLVLIVTGKGGRMPDSDAPFDLELDRRSRGVLKQMTPRWLAGSELARLIADIRPAHRRHGGAGALYVYLRKRAR
jgi:DNA-nicking Smr family endonuclease